MRKHNFNIERVPEEVGEAALGTFAVRLSEGSVMILLSDGTAFQIGLYDYVGEGEMDEYPDSTEPLSDRISEPSAFLASRAAIAAHLNIAHVPSGVIKLRTAAPLCGTDSLPDDTVMFRYTAGVTDICYSPATGTLRDRTYLVPPKDDVFLNSGFGAVGRYSLPCPHPARYRHEYKLKKGMTFSVGTVEPQFRQAGGGVEVRLNQVEPVIHVCTRQIDDY